jgi:hypothetical protein
MRAFYTPTVEEASRLGSGRPGGAGGGANVWELIKWIEEDASRQGPRLRMRPDGGCRVLYFLGEKNEDSNDVYVYILHVQRIRFNDF